MRRILLTALAVALLVGVFAGVASARLAGDGPAAPKSAPFRAPAAMPLEDAKHPGSFGFRSSDAIAAKLEGGNPAGGAAAAPAGGASATVTITATVLPVVTIVVDESDDVVELVTNTPERDARGVLYLVRSASGALATLDAATWADARTALAAAHEGTGTIWSA